MEAMLMHTYTITIAEHGRQAPKVLSVQADTAIEAMREARMNCPRAEILSCKLARVEY